MLNESQAIACYLCSKKPGPLYPEDPQQRALVDQWMSFALAHWGRGWQPLQFEQLVKKMFGMGEPDTALVTAGLDFFHRHAYLINKHMNDRLWLVGDEPTLADFCVGAGLINHALIPLPVDDYPAMMSWYARVDALPAWAATAPKG